MRATSLLRRDHLRLRGLLLGCAARGGGGGLLDRLRRSLRLHLALEEELFYPGVLAGPSPEAEEALCEPLDRHALVDALAWELARSKPGQRRFAFLVRELRKAVERHIRDDERTLFREARRRLSRERMERLGAEMQARIRVVTRPPLGE